MEGRREPKRRRVAAGAGSRRPAAPDPFRSPTRRALLGEALADLVRIDPFYLTRGALLSSSAVAQINQILNNVGAALAKVANVRAGLAPGDALLFDAPLAKIENNLGVATLDLIDDALEILGAPTSKRADRSLRRAQRQHERARRMRDRVQRMLLAAEDSDDVRRTGRLRLRGVRLGRKTFRRVVRAAELYERAGVLTAAPVE